MRELDELLGMIEMEDFLDYEGIDYRVTDGSSGVQLQLRECPFCGNSKSKVYIGRDTGLGNCFAGSCPQKTFNKWSFIRAQLGLDNRKTFQYIKRMAQSIGWRPKREARPVESAEISVQLPDHLTLPIKGKNLKYLEMRGIGLDLVRYFDLRYAHRSWYSYKGKDDGQIRRQLYEKRVIIPVYDLIGKLVTFQGRDITGKAQEKYLFPPGLPGTGSHLYNGHNVTPGTQRIIICEGAFDVIAAKKALDQDLVLRDVVPVGTFGKNLSHGRADATDQLGKLIFLRRQGLEEATIMWDGELKTSLDAIKAAAMISEVGIRARVAFLPKDRDPNEITATQFLQAFRGAQTWTKMAAVRMSAKADSLYA